MTDVSGASEPAVRVSKLGYVQFTTPDVDRLVELFSIAPDHLDQLNGTSVPDFFAWKKQARSFEWMGGLSNSAVDFGAAQRRLDSRDDAGRHLVLQVEDVRKFTIESISPDVLTGLRLDELARDAYPSSCLTYAALEHVANSEVPGDMLHVHGPALVSKTRVPGYDEEPFHLREGRDDVLHHAVGKIFLLWIAAHVLERQHRDRGFVRKREELGSPGR